MLNFKVKLASNRNFPPKFHREPMQHGPLLIARYNYYTVNSHSYNKKLHSYKNITILVCISEVNGSSRKYTGGQSRDQSVFENGAIWMRLSLLIISTGRVGSDFYSTSHPDGHHVMYGCTASCRGMSHLVCHCQPFAQ